MKIWRTICICMENIWASMVPWYFSNIQQWKVLVNIDSLIQSSKPLVYTMVEEYLLAFASPWISNWNNLTALNFWIHIFSSNQVLCFDWACSVFWLPSLFDPFGHSRLLVEKHFDFLERQEQIVASLEYLFAHFCLFLVWSPKTRIYLLFCLFFVLFSMSLFLLYLSIFMITKFHLQGRRVDDFMFPILLQQIQFILMFL